MTKVLTPEQYKKKFPKDEAYQLKYNKAASQFYYHKMLELVDNDPTRLGEMRGYVPSLELPGHLMYRVDTLYSSDGHRKYEFLIEYDTDSPSEGIYYGCRGITNEGYNHEEEIEQFRKDWDIVKAELCLILNNTYPLKDFSHRFKMTDNANTNTYWLFWISLYEDEDINKVGVTATTIIRNVFRRYLNGEEFRLRKMPQKNLQEEKTSFTSRTYKALLENIQYVDGNQKVDNEKTKLVREHFEKFIKGAVNQRLLMSDPSYECAWRFMMEGDVAFARMMYALFDYFLDCKLICKSFKSDETQEKIEVPWTAITRVFLDCEGQAYTTNIRTQVAKRKGGIDKEISEWKDTIKECINNS